MTHPTIQEFRDLKLDLVNIVSRHQNPTEIKDLASQYYMYLHTKCAFAYDMALKFVDRYREEYGK